MDVGTRLGWCLLLISGCGDDAVARDAGDRSGSDAGSRDGGSRDAMPGSDAGATPPTATPCGDAAAVGTARYVRAGASGDGTSWAAAYAGLPDDLERGLTYCVADGEYGDYRFDDPPSGTTPIAVVKATVSDHGSDDGWDPSYADGQAIFGRITIDHDASYWIFDGQRRNEADWSDSSAYGFRASEFYAEVPNVATDYCADHITIRYTDVGGDDIGNVYSAEQPGSGFYWPGYNDPCSSWTVQRSRVHNVLIAFQMAGAEDALVEHNAIENAFSKECIRGQNRAAGHVIRFNRFQDCCQLDPEDGPGSTCTAEIAMWGSDTPGDYDRIEVYGNTFRVTVPTETHTGGVIVLGGDGVSWVGVPANDARVYNNTLVDIPDFASGILVNGTGECRNNLVHDAARYSVVCEIASDNLDAPSDPFADSTSGDLHLASPTAGGFVLPAPYDVDLEGRPRGADGTWDLGAYEYAAD